MIQSFDNMHGTPDNLGYKTGLVGGQYRFLQLDNLCQPKDLA